MKTILAPVDFSSVTENVVLEAATIARALDGRVVLLNVTQPPPVVADSSAFMMDVSAVTEFAAKAAVPQLEALQEKLAHDYVATETMQQTGYPLTLILEQARKLPADYIVMGSHGHTAFYDLLVGSTASAVIKRAPCPVVIVPAPMPQEKSAKAKRSAPAVAPVTTR